MNEFNIETENWREYVYPNGTIYRIVDPVKLFLKQDEKGDSHRIMDKQGVVHYPVRGWAVIRWFAPDVPVSF